MFSSKFYYMVAGFDIAFAMLSAVTHDAFRLVGFLGLAFLMSWLGDKKVEEDKGENNNG